jgi:ABC-type Mn2+/Zn2+ transport system permease subunit
VGLNSRVAQIVWGLVPLVLAGSILELPFIWRALKTKKRSDIRLAVIWLLYVIFTQDSSTLREDVPAALIWISAFAAAVAAAYVYRPLNKEERMDQAAQDRRPGSSYL